MEEQSLVSRASPNMQHGSLWQKLKTNPKFGQRFCSGGLELSVVPARPYEVSFVANKDIVTLSAGSSRGFSRFNSDKVRNMESEAGNVFFMPAGSDVYVATQSSNGASILHLPQDWREDLRAELGRKAPADLSRVFENLTSPNFFMLGQLIKQFIFDDATGGKSAAEALSVLVLTDVLRATANWNADENLRSLDQERIKRVLVFVEENISENISVGDLATQAGFSLFHFSRAFKLAVGVSPHQYILQRRVDVACEMLSKTKVGLAEIAYRVGFSSQAHMTTAFKKRFGTTPGRYRNTLRN